MQLLMLLVAHEEYIVYYRESVEEINEQTVWLKLVDSLSSSLFDLFDLSWFGLWGNLTKQHTPNSWYHSPDSYNSCLHGALHSLKNCKCLYGAICKMSNGLSLTETINRQRNV